MPNNNGRSPINETNSDMTREKDVEFQPGDLVYVKIPRRYVGMSDKLLSPYFGPYQVIRRTSTNNYELEDNRGNRDVHPVELMKPYFGRHDEAARSADPTQPSTSTQQQQRHVRFSDFVDEIPQLYSPMVKKVCFSDDVEVRTYTPQPSSTSSSSCRQYHQSHSIHTSPKFIY